ncbi:hypothetical protein G7046_g5612 [Stylonectria norvegica]|nr:hypothetical protein G7046_g5612 [Stylonectria norvegica]
MRRNAAGIACKLDRPGLQEVPVERHRPREFDDLQNHASNLDPIHVGSVNAMAASIYRATQSLRTLTYAVDFAWKRMPAIFTLHFDTSAVTLLYRSITPPYALTSEALQAGTPQAEALARVDAPADPMPVEAPRAGVRDHPIRTPLNKEAAPKGVDGSFNKTSDGSHASRHGSNDTSSAQEYDIVDGADPRLEEYLWDTERPLELFVPPNYTSNHPGRF